MFVIVILVAAFLSTQMSVGELMPATTEKQQQLMMGFAEAGAVSCDWKIPTVLQYLIAGRPALVPNAVCTQRFPSPTDNLSEQAVTIRTTFKDWAERYFANEDIVVGVKFGNPGAALTCFSPKNTVKWSRCLGDSNLGCLLAKCTAGLPPE